MTQHFDLTDIRLFVNIADCLSLTRGAERAHMSVPAASVRIRNLEETVGTKLLKRGPRGVTLTAPGQAFVHHARLIMHQLEGLWEDLRDYTEGVKGHLRLSATTTAMAEFLPPVLRGFLSNHPDVSVELRERSSGDIVRALTELRIDIGIVAGRVNTEGLAVMPYRSDRLVLVTPIDHSLAGGENARFIETLDFDHVGLHEAAAIHSFVQSHAQELNRSVRLRIQVGNFEAACRMIEANVGIGILPASAANRHQNNMSIRVVPLKDEWAVRHLKVCARSFHNLPPFAVDLIEQLRMDAGNCAATPEFACLL
ncbi:LysR substrate-binding domain-containing protein [Paraburkholderia sp. D1E]|uniref:LysR substrate-binding domain-containing protein n=1 Tax=Paraburkholderia sp. D1E TaxID=3461398 RepID=UPI004046424C